jgi:Protein of unknown function (DUF4242)
MYNSKMVQRKLTISPHFAVRKFLFSCRELVQVEEAMQRFVIERDIPNIGAADALFLKNAAKKSNEVLRQLGNDIQWVESYIAGDKLFCIYLATNEDLIRKHSEMSGFSRHKDL